MSAATAKAITCKTTCFGGASAGARTVWTAAAWTEPRRRAGPPFQDRL